MAGDISLSHQMRVGMNALTPLPRPRCTDLFGQTHLPESEAMRIHGLCRLTQGASNVSPKVVLVKQDAALRPTTSYDLESDTTD